MDTSRSSTDVCQILPFPGVSLKALGLVPSAASSMSLSEAAGYKAGPQDLLGALGSAPFAWTDPQHPSAFAASVLQHPQFFAFLVVQASNLRSLSYRASNTLSNYTSQGYALHGSQSDVPNSDQTVVSVLYEGHVVGRISKTGLSLRWLAGRGHGPAILAVLPDLARHLCRRVSMQEPRPERAGRSV